MGKQSCLRDVMKDDAIGIVIAEIVDEAKVSKEVTIEAQQTFKCLI